MSTVTVSSRPGRRVVAAAGGRAGQHGTVTGPEPGSDLYIRVEWDDGTFDPYHKADLRDEPPGDGPVNPWPPALRPLGAVFAEMDAERAASQPAEPDPPPATVPVTVTFTLTADQLTGYCREYALGDWPPPPWTTAPGQPGGPQWQPDPAAGLADFREHLGEQIDEALRSVYTLREFTTWTLTDPDGTEL